MVLLLAVALNATAPSPFPLEPLVTVSHDVLLLTPVHEQPAGDVTLVEPAPPLTATEALVGEIVEVHVMPGCVTVNVLPATVSVALRCVGLLLAAALNAIVPLPLPLAPLVTVSHVVSLLTPVHEQPVGDVTLVDPAPPPTATEALDGEIAYVHDSAAWLMV